MADALQLPSFSPGVKRTHDGLPVASGLDLTPQTSYNNSSTRDASPAPSDSSSALSELTAPTPQPPKTSDLAAPAAKKPKLTFAEKQTEQAIQRLIKEERAKLKADEKTRKEVEKRAKAEEKEAAKRQKDIEKAEKEAEKLEKQKAKDAEKAVKDAEKAKKEADKAAEQAKKETDKLKKERVSLLEKRAVFVLTQKQSQMRLGAFFNRPAAASTPPSTPDHGSVGVSSRRSSIASIDMDKPEVEATPAKGKSQSSSWILPFFLLEHTELAPYNRFLSSFNRSTSDPGWLHNQKGSVKAQGLFRTRRARIQRVKPVREMVAKLDGGDNAPIDLTTEYSASAAPEGLKRVPYKVLHFKEDVRPPYQGTYTKPVSPRSARRLSRRPAYRGLPETDYDYDSEAEWQEPEPDDEDLEGDDDLSEEEDGAEEMDDFLDDEADAGKRLVTTSDVEPVSTGLCWQGRTDLSKVGVDLNRYQMQPMHDDQRMPIDPYSTAHWKTDKQAADSAVEASNIMQPPRLPLANVSVNSSSLRAFVTGAKVESTQQENSVTGPVRGRPRTSDKPVRTIPEPLLPSFKAAIDGSDLNKIALVEILKKQFPNCSKDAIRGSLDLVAVRMGVKEADKRWALRE